MGHLDHSVATLRLFGDDLQPEDISRLLGAKATEAHRKGDEIVGKFSSSVRIAKTGSWRLSAVRREPEDLESQIFEVLGQLSSDLSIWRMLGERYKLDFFCGIFMSGSNDGLPLSYKVLRALGERCINLDLDIYDTSSD